MNSQAASFGARSTELRVIDLVRVHGWRFAHALVRRVFLCALLFALIGHSQGGQHLSPVALGQGTSFPVTIRQTQSSSTGSEPTPTAAAPASPEGLHRWLPHDPDDLRKALLTFLLGLLSALLIVFFKRVLRILKSAIDWAWNRIRTEKALETRYRRRLSKELRAVQILSMSKAKNLEAIYIPLRLAQWMSPDLRDNVQRADEETISLSEALNKYERLTIVGDPGAGKTTITSHAAAALADYSSRIDDQYYFPVYIQLRLLKDFLRTEKERSIKELAAEAMERFGFSPAMGFLKRKLDDGQCLIVLDGFDELADQEKSLQFRLAQKIRDFVTSISPGNRILLTSRTASYEPAWFTGFQVLEMTDLTLPQIEDFVGGWFGREQQEWAKYLIDILSNNVRLQIMVSNPLMLAIVCFVYGTRNPKENYLPRRRVDLYERCIEALIDKWDSSRGINREPSFRPTEIEKVLSYVAYDALVEEKIDFLHDELLSHIRTHIRKTGEHKQYEDEIFLDEVLKHTGLFKEKGNDTIGFIHRTFQEYLAARVIEEKVLRGVELKDLRDEIFDVIRNLRNDFWAEPIALAAGMLKGRTELPSVLYEEHKVRPTIELQILLAACLRDADLTKLDYEADYLLKQDEILTGLVETALANEERNGKYT